MMVLLVHFCQSSLSVEETMLSAFLSSNWRFNLVVHTNGQEHLLKKKKTTKTVCLFFFTFDAVT